MVTLKKPEGERVAGYYVTTTDAALILVTLAKPRGQRCTATAGSKPFRIVAVPADDIARTVIGPAQRKVTSKVYCDFEQNRLSALP